MKRFLRIAIPTAVALVLTVPAARSAPQVPAYTVVESGRGFDRLQDAVNSIGSGTGTIRFASFAFADCAVQTDGDILYTAEVPGQAVLDGVACEGKAALVLRGRRARVVGLVFTHIKVPDFNGAGIRLEHGDLEISQSWFRDSQQGILAGDDRGGTITIDKSTFTRLGTCEGPGGCAHSIYIGYYGALNVTRTRFEAGRGGHYLKSRSPRVSIVGNSFDDSAGHETNYMIDLSNGSTGQIAGNWFVQGKDKENYSTLIAVAAEGKHNSSAGLRIEGNNARMAPGVTFSSSFVGDWSGDALAIGANTLGAGLTRSVRH
jgi:Right handed beta helix region